MHYYRVILRAEDRINSSDWATPEFYLGLPITRHAPNATAKVCVESAFINQHDDSGNDENDHNIEIDVLNPLPTNVYKTATNGYEMSGNLAMVPQYERETNQSIYVHQLVSNNNDINQMYNEYKVLDFNNKIFKLRLSRLGTDDSLIVVPSGTGAAETQNYRITLGIYIDDKE